MYKYIKYKKGEKNYFGNRFDKIKIILCFKSLQANIVTVKL